MSVDKSVTFDLLFRRKIKCNARATIFHMKLGKNNSGQILTYTYINLLKYEQKNTNVSVKYYDISFPIF